MRFFILLLTVIVQTIGNSPNGKWLEVEEELLSLNVCKKEETLCEKFFSINFDEINKGNRKEGWNETAVHGTYQSMGFIKFVQMKCQCDPDCVRYGDCCLDTAKKSERNEATGESWSCLPLRSKDNAREFDEMFYIYMVGSCPSHFPDDDITKAMCERNLSLTNHSAYTYYMDVPVFSYVTNRTYANIYCASCHSDVNFLASWNVSVKCDENFESFNVTQETMFSTQNYDVGKKSWTYSTDEYELKCSLVIEEFLNIAEYLNNTNSRRCTPNIDKCSVEWQIQEDLVKCRSYTMLTLADNKVYKNPHCAKCNFVPSNKTACYYKSLLSPRYAAPIPFGKDYYSFSILLDFDFGAKGEHVDFSKKNCKQDEIFDYLHKRCHTVVCGAMFINENGACIPRKRRDLNTSSQSIEESYLNSTCPRIIVEDQDYITLNNGSIWLNLTHQLLQPNEFEQNPNGGLSICAVLMAQDQYFQYSRGSAQHLLSDICLIISVFCLALHIIIHIVLPKLRNLPGKNLLSLSCALLCGQLFFLIGMAIRESAGYGVCAAIGIMTHWSYLSAFFWMNVMGFDVCRTFSNSRILIRHRTPGQSSHSTFVKYSLYAWGFPSLIVMIGMILDFGSYLEEYAPSYGTRVCWISNRKGLGILFVLPVALLLLENLFLFTVTVHSILQQKDAAKFAVETKQSYRKNVRSSRQPSVTENLQPPLLKKHSEPSRMTSYPKDKQQIRFILYIKLGLIMGLGWIFGFIAALAKISALWYPFILFNGLQGAFIFIAFDCKKKIYYMLYFWVKRRNHPDDSSSNSRPTSSFTKTSANSQRINSTLSTTLSSNDQYGRKSQMAPNKESVRENSSSNLA